MSRPPIVTAARRAESRLAQHYFALSAGELVRARNYRTQAARHAANGFPETAHAFGRLVTSTVRLARTFHRSGRAAMRRADTL